MEINEESVKRGEEDKGNDAARWDREEGLGGIREGHEWKRRS